VGRIGPHAKPAVPVLLRLRNNKFLGERATYRQTGYMPRLDARPETPSAAGLLSEDLVDLRPIVGEALKRIDPEAARRAGVP
jgi:hypothetical protein